MKSRRLDVFVFTSESRYWFLTFATRLILQWSHLHKNCQNDPRVQLFVAYVTRTKIYLAGSEKQTRLFEYFVQNLILADLQTLYYMIQEKTYFPSVGIKPRPLAQVSETILTELTHHLLRVWKFKILIVMLFWF